MKRHLVKEANRPSQRSKKVAVKPLETPQLEPVTGDEGPILSGAEDVKPGENKKSWPVFPVQVPRKKAGTPAAVNPEKSRKETARKPSVRPSSRKSRRGPEQPPSQT
ncbi:MAG TPA: hypothetical protein VN851_28800 [Thermoanaerobaculia bacterium]|nr:hypothetical protein [Thermoanaerobaculia bacterium]